MSFTRNVEPASNGANRRQTARVELDGITLVAVSPTAADGAHTLLWVQVVPGARASGIVGAHGDALRLKVTAPPSDGRANAAVEALLARVLDLPIRSVRVIAGHTSRRKRIRIDAASDAVRDRLAAT